MKSFFCAILALGLASAAPAYSKSGALSNSELMQLTENGISLILGGPDLGYTGKLKLTKDGKGRGSATTDAGDKIDIRGTWSIQGDQFCRIWKSLNDGKEVCETWVSTSDRSVDVYNGDKKIGKNSW